MCALALVAASSTFSISLRIAKIQSLAPGQFFLARCEPVETPDELRSVDSPYLRRPLFPTRIERDGNGWRVSFLLEDLADEGYAWLASQIEGESVDLLGPFGSGFAIQPQTRSMLLVADAARAPALFPLMEAILDKGGRVTLLVRDSGEDAPTLLAGLPYAVEARSEGAATFGDAFSEMVRWADQVCIALTSHDYAQFSRRVREVRMRPTHRFAQALVRTPLPCGVGACLACVTPLGNGRHTRACVHGPVFDLLELG